MIRYHSLTSIPGILLYCYYLFVFLAFVYLIFKNAKSYFSVFIILLAFPGLFGFIPVFNSFYKVFVLVYAIYVCINRGAFKLKLFLRFKWIFLSFFLFTIMSLYSGFFNGDTYTMIFSQYSKYFIAFICFYLLILEFENHKNLIPDHVKLIIDIIKCQIFLSFVKLLFIGILESIVGSLSYLGGALGTVFPVIAFIFVWVVRNGKIKKEDYLLIVGLFIIGFASNKRAIWFILPCVIFAMLTYVSKRKIKPGIWLLLGLVPVFFYLGVRLNPSLNAEHEIGGSFDFDFVYDYVDRYTFGDKDSEEVGKGRGGATVFLLDKVFNGNLNSHDIFGYGIEKYNGSDYEEFNNYDFGIQSKGAAAGFFQTYITIGVVGIITTLLFFISFFFRIKLGRLSVVLFFIIFWEYFFYTGLIFRIPILPFLIIFCLLYRKYSLFYNNQRDIQLKDMSI